MPAHACRRAGAGRRSEMTRQSRVLILKNLFHIYDDLDKYSIAVF